LDPPFTRLIKIDILVSLALEPAAIEAVLNELRTYIRHGDKAFASSAIRSVGKVAELARVVYDRHGHIHQRTTKERQTANRIALDALYGLAMVTQTSDSKVIVGEAVNVMHNILLLLGSTSIGHRGEIVLVDDPNNVQAFALRRILLLLVNTLSNRRTDLLERNDDDDYDDEREVSSLALMSLDLPPAALSSALWVMGEWLANTPSFTTSTWTSGKQDIGQVRKELIRLVDRCFSDLDPSTKDEAIHFASKVWISIAMVQSLTPSLSGSTSEMAVCEHILSMGRVDVNPDVKDRARFESSVFHTAIGLKFDTDGMDERPGSASMTIANARTILLSNKPSPSYLRIEDDATLDMNSFRFGTLSSLVGHRARGTYLPLPNWSKENSPSLLRESIEAAKEQLAPVFMGQSQTTTGPHSGFYDEDVKGPKRVDDSDESSSSGSSSSSSNSSSSEESDGQNADSESDSDDDSSSESSGAKNDRHTTDPSINGSMIQKSHLLQPVLHQNEIPAVPAFQSHLSSQASSDDEDSSSDDSDDSTSDDEKYHGDVSSANLVKSNNMAASANGNDGNLLGLMAANGFAPVPEVSNSTQSSVLDDLKGLVLAPITIPDQRETAPDMERDSSAWIQLVRPELCGGLSVEARYLRGPTKMHQLQIRNIMQGNPCIVCIQVRFGNK
jgi:AP-3 complex subunit beta